jgi:hypothetical protein
MFNPLEFQRRVSQILYSLYGPEFEQLLIQSRAVIGGSFVISTALELSWNDQDIDVYVNSDFYRLDEYIRNCLGGVPFKYNDYTNPGVVVSYKYFTPTVPINIIQVENPSIPDYIFRTSDLTICTCFYDFYVVHVHSDVFSRIACPINEHLIEKRRDPVPASPSEHLRVGQFNPLENVRRKRRMRLVKYSMRGFGVPTVFNNIDFIAYTEYMNATYETRQLLEIKLFRLIHLICMNESGKRLSYVQNPDRIYSNLRKIKKHCEKRPSGRLFTFEVLPFLRCWVSAYAEFRSLNPELMLDWEANYGDKF